MEVRDTDSVWGLLHSTFQIIVSPREALHCVQLGKLDYKQPFSDSLESQVTYAISKWVSWNMRAWDYVTFVHVVHATMKLCCNHLPLAHVMSLVKEHSLKVFMDWLDWTLSC